MKGSAHTPGPWMVWEGPSYVGGGADLCIGHGEAWLANMDHRQPRCPQILESGHFNGEACSICTIDSEPITAEQRANAHLISAAPELLELVRVALRAVESGAVALWTDADLAILRAAIAKAEGREG